MRKTRFARASLWAIALLIAPLALSGCFGPLRVETRVLYDDFSTAANPWPSGSSPDQSASWGRVGSGLSGYYHMDVSGRPKTATAGFPVSSLQHFSATAKAWLEQPATNASYGLAFGVTGSGGATSNTKFYLFRVDPNAQTWEVRKYDGGWASAPIASGGSASGISPGTAVNELSVSSVLGLADVYVNGNQLNGRSLGCPALGSTSYLAFYIQNEFVPAYVGFDDVAVLGVSFSLKDARTVPCIEPCPIPPGIGPEAAPMPIPGQ
ncbi:MAG: hypothetical protein VB144_12635 [Clostridia bacterium]|nr:hypothetical protein [Clostridia bacterium]